MEKLGNWQYRKKNMADPLANPVWFFRGKNRDPAADKKVTLEHFERRLNDKYKNEQEHYKMVRGVITGLKNHDLDTDKKKLARPHSAIP